MSVRYLYKISLFLAFCFGVLSLLACSASSKAQKPSKTRPVLQKLSNISPSDGESVIQFVSENQGWLAKGKNLWRSSDGGKSWQSIYSGDPSWEQFASISNLQFVDNQLGWMTVAPQGIYKTVDGGKTWKKQPDPIPDLVYQSIHFSSDGARGWIAGTVLKPPPREYADKTPRSDEYPVILSTVNGGRTWGKQIVPNTRGIVSFNFSTGNQAWALGWPGLFRLDTTKGTLAEVDFVKSNCPQYRLLEAVEIENPHLQTALYFLDTEQGWLGFRNGYIAKTTDGGKTWCDLLDPKDIWPEFSWDTHWQSIYFANAESGWALGADGALYRSTDGGKKWSKVAAEDEFLKMFFLNEQNGWVLSSSVLYRIQ